VKKQFHAELMLLLVTFFWGVSFPVIKIATPFISPVLFVTIRFLLATVIMIIVWPLVGGKFRELANWASVRWGFLMGGLIAVGYTTQTVGLHYTSPNNSAFITALSVIIVPFILLIFHKIRPSRFVGIGVMLALAGLILMTRPELGNVNKGDLWTLLCALSYAIYLARLNYAYEKVSYLNLIFWTMIFSTVITAFWAVAIETTFVTWNTEVISALVITATLCTLLGFYLHTRYQQFTTATRAALIFSSEPVFAALFTWLLLHEGLSISGIIGAALILGGVIFAELGGSKQEEIKMKVLFVCNANSCRSQMAECFAKSMFPSDWRCQSAGLSIFPIIDNTKNAMLRMGLQMKGQASKSIDSVNMDSFDLIITLSKEAGQFLPNKIQAEKHRNIPVKDPMSFHGNDEETVAAFDKCRDEIKEIVQQIIDKQL
jgi:drug/metabolite transporter (DMT)-like permease/protein-tyrosine-phosphatase